MSVYLFRTLGSSHIIGKAWFSRLDARKILAIVLFAFLLPVASPLIGARPTEQQLRSYIPNPQEIGISFERFPSIDVVVLEGLKRQCNSSCQEYDEMIPFFRKHGLVMHRYMHITGNVERVTCIDFHVVNDIDAYLGDIRTVIRLLIPGDSEICRARIVTIEGREFLEVYTPPHPGGDEYLALLFAAEGMLVSISQGGRIDADFLRRLAVLVWDNVNESVRIVRIRSPGQEGEGAELKAYFTLSPSSPTTYDKVVFSALTSDAIAEYLWYLDGKYLEDVGNTWQWSWTEPAPGEHTVRLVVRDDEGNTDEYSVSFTIEELTMPIMRVMEESVANGRVETKPLKTTFRVIKPDGGQEFWDTDSNGAVNLTLFVTDSWGSVVPGTYQIEFHSLPKAGEEWRRKWGTYELYPMWSEKQPPRVRMLVEKDENSPAGFRITVLYTDSLWVVDDNGRRVAVWRGLGPSRLTLNAMELRLVLRRIDAWEQLLRGEVARFLVSSGVDAATAQSIASVNTEYGVDCGTCGSEPCPAEYLPSTSTLRFRLPANQLFSFRGLVEENTVGDWLHEVGHLVKERLLHDPGARLGGYHTSEWDPASNLDTAYDEGFANLFPILVTDFSSRLPHYHKEVYSTNKYKGRHASGKPGDWIEGRITGFWVALYGLSYSGTADSVAAFRDFLRVCRAFHAVRHRYPRTISEWVYAKAALDPGSLSRIVELAKTSAYDLDVAYKLDAPEAYGILRSSGAQGLTAIVYSQSLAATLSPPSRFSVKDQASRSLARGALSVLPLVVGDAFKSTGVGYDGSIYIRRSGDPSPSNWLRVDIYGINLVSRDKGIVRLEKAGELYVGRESKVHIEKIGGGAGPLTIRTDSATITSMNSEFIIEVDSAGVTQVTVLEGEVVIEASAQQVTLHGGQRTTAAIGSPPTPPSPVDTGSIEKWWSEGGEEQTTHCPSERPSFVAKCLEKGLSTLPLSTVTPKRYPGAVATVLMSIQGASDVVHSALSPYPEAAAVAALLTSALLIGVVFLLAPAAIAALIARKLGAKGPSPLPSLVTFLWLASLAATAAGAYLEHAALTTAAATALALTTPLIPPALAVREILGRPGKGQRSQSVWMNGR